MVRKAGQKRKKIERFLREEFKRTGKQVTKQPLANSLAQQGTPRMNEIE